MKLITFLEQLDIPYKDLNLYKQAFTHPSYTNEKGREGEDYERLEFLGDAVLQYHVSRYLFDLYPDMPEGNLTTLRSKLVREESLARFARELNLGELIYLGTGEINNGGRDRNSLLADVFEAFIGALRLDTDINEVEKMLQKTIYKHVNDIYYDDITDYKTTLQELVQADARKNVTYRLISTTGPANAPSFEIEVVMGNIRLGVGRGSSKKKAEQQAAKAALKKLAKSDFHA